MDAKFKGLIKCSICNYTFKGRLERTQIKYRCNNRLRNGKDKCPNDNCIEEDFLYAHIKQQLYVIDREDINDYKSIIDYILVSPERMDVFYKNLQIKHSYVDNKHLKIHFETKTL